MYIDFENNKLPESIEDYINLDNLSQSAIYTDTSQCTRFNPGQAQNPCNKYRQLDCNCYNDCCIFDCMCDSDCNCYDDCCDKDCHCDWDCRCYRYSVGSGSCNIDCCNSDCCDENCCYEDCSCDDDCCNSDCHCDSDSTSVIGYNGYCLKYKINPCGSNSESCSSYCRCNSDGYCNSYCCDRDCCDNDCSCDSDCCDSDCRCDSDWPWSQGHCSCDNDCSCNSDCCDSDCSCDSDYCNDCSCDSDFSSCRCNIDSKNNTCSDCDSYCYKDMQLWSIKRIDSAAITEYSGTPPNHSSNQSNNRLFRLDELNSGNMFNYNKWFKNAWDETSPYKLQRGHDVWPIRTMSGQQQTQNPKFYGE